MATAQWHIASQLLLTEINFVDILNIIVKVGLLNYYAPRGKICNKPQNLGVVGYICFLICSAEKVPLNSLAELYCMIPYK